MSRNRSPTLELMLEGHRQSASNGDRIHQRAARARQALIALLGVTVLVLSGCADFSEQDQAREAGTYSSNPVPDIIEPDPPDAPVNPDEDEGPPPTGPCVDPDGAVIATCLVSTGGVQPADPEGRTTYVAERTTGKLIISKRYGPQRELASVAVDGSGDGGFVDFAFSPTYEQDRLIYALITTGADNRVVRLAPNDEPTPILTGIPKGATGNMGALFFRSPAELVVATGNAGNPQAADNPSSLAGKVFVLSPDNPDNPDGAPRIIANGFGSDVSLCSDRESGQLYAADSGPSGDRLFAVDDGDPRLLWQWTDQPGVAGCAVSAGAIFVAMADAKRIDSMTAPTPTSPNISEPTATDVSERFGAVGRLAPIPGGIQLATVNKSTPDAEVRQTDDRVAIFDPPQPVEDRM